MATRNSTCSIDSCDRSARCRGMCMTHYGNLYKYGHAIPRRDWSIEETLDDCGWDITEAGCWEWRGDRNELGYGRITLKRKGLFKARVHRVMFERYFGPIPDGMIVRHKCDNPPCSNPDHLELGTMADNTRDMMERGRHHTSGLTECRAGHDLTDEANFRLAARGAGKTERVCLTCQRERHLRHQEKKKLDRAKIRNSNEAA